MIEFKVNDYVSLRLEDEKTVIYVAGKRFRQCKYLLLDIPVDEIREFDQIESIDDAAERLDKSMEDEVSPRIIPAKVEFWGHCSNLQVWSERNYDTRLLHSDLSFPLLRKLSESGDIVALRVFKEEIAKRFSQGNDTVRTFLILKSFYNPWLLVLYENEEFRGFSNKRGRKSENCTLLIFNNKVYFIKRCFQGKLQNFQTLDIDFNLLSIS